MSNSNNVTDRIQIIELINHFGMAIDLRDWESFQNLFAKSVEFDYSSIGEVAATLHPADIANTARSDLGGFQTTQHVITNHLVQVQDNNATCQAHVRAMHFLPNEGESTLEMGGYYTAKLIRIEDNWKIKGWKFTVLWSRGNEQLFELAKQTPNDAYDSTVGNEQ